MRGQVQTACGWSFFSQARPAFRPGCEGVQHEARVSKQVLRSTLQKADLQSCTISAKLAVQLSSNPPKSLVLLNLARFNNTVGNESELDCYAMVAAARHG